MLRRGDVLIAVTDGITETLSPGGEEFGMERVAEHIRGHRALPARALALSLVAAAEAFAGGEPAADDRTVIAVRRKEGAP